MSWEGLLFQSKLEIVSIPTNDASFTKKSGKNSKTNIKNPIKNHSTELLIGIVPFLTAFKTIKK